MQSYLNTAVAVYLACASLDAKQHALASYCKAVSQDNDAAYALYCDALSALHTLYIRYAAGAANAAAIVHARAAASDFAAAHGYW
jgi:hypothetical protein